MKIAWGNATLTLPASFTRMKAETKALAWKSDVLYYIYDAGEYVTVVNTERRRDRVIKGLTDCAVYAADLTAGRSERIL